MMRVGQLRPRVIPQMSLKVSSMRLSIRMAMSAKMTRPVTPRVAPWVFWTNCRSQRAISFLIVDLTGLGPATILVDITRGDGGGVGSDGEIRAAISFHR